MSYRFRKSPEGVAAYQAIKYPYPETVNDGLYEQFLKQTRKSPEDVNQKIILSMGRIQSSFADEKHKEVRLLSLFIEKGMMDNDDVSQYLDFLKWKVQKQQYASVYE